MGQTVNLLLNCFEGSNPSLPTVSTEASAKVGSVRSHNKAISHEAAGAVSIPDHGKIKITGGNEWSFGSGYRKKKDSVDGNRNFFEI
jgi:hypothetical protein